MKYQFKNVRGLKRAKVKPEDVIKVEADENYSVFLFCQRKEHNPGQNPQGMRRNF